MAALRIRTIKKKFSNLHHGNRNDDLRESEKFARPHPFPCQECKGFLVNWQYCLEERIGRIGHTYASIPRVQLLRHKDLFWSLLGPK